MFPHGIFASQPVEADEYIPLEPSGLVSAAELGLDEFLPNPLLPALSFGLQQLVAGYGGAQ